MKKPSTQMQETAHRRVPVYADTPDQIVGILDVKHFLLDQREHYTEALIAPSFVPETMRALDLLRSFLSHAQGLAIVVDEFGGTEGIITLTDIIEEIMSDAAPLGRRRSLHRTTRGRPIPRQRKCAPRRLERASRVRTGGGRHRHHRRIRFSIGWVILPPSGTRFEMPRLAITVRRTGRKRIEEILLEKTTAFRMNDQRRRQRRDRNHDLRLDHSCLLGGFVFLCAGIEAGLLSIDPVRLRHHVKQGKSLPRCVWSG